MVVDRHASSQAKQRISSENHQTFNKDGVILKCGIFSFANRLPYSLILVFAVSLLCFANSYNGDFVFDDLEAIKNNKDVRLDSHLYQVFQNDFWGTKIVSNDSHKSYRPITVLSFRLNYWISGGLYPTSFHITNLLLYSCVCSLFLFLSTLLFGFLIDDHHETTTVKLSTFCALLFAAHPIHTETVAGIVGRADLLCSIFFCLSIICYISSCQPNQHKMGKKPSSYSFICLLLSMILAFVAMLCKEQGITVLGVCSVFNILYHFDIRFWRFLSFQDDNESVNIYNNNNIGDQVRKQSITKKLDSRFNYRLFVFRHLVLLISGVLMLVFRWHIMGYSKPVFQRSANPHSFISSAFYRAINYNYIYSINAWLLMNPWWSCFDWSMGCIPIVESLSDPRNLATIVMWSFFVLLTVTMLLTKSRAHFNVACLSLAIIVVTFLPSSNLFFRVGFVVAERNLFLPSFGYCIFVVYSANHLATVSKSMRKIVSVCFYFVIIIFIIKSISRSSEWKKEITLFTSGLKVCPLNSKVHYNIGKMCSDTGNDKCAIKEYKLAIQLEPTYERAYNNLGNLMKDKNKFQEAEKLLSKAVQIRPSFAAAWMNLGIVQSALNKNQLALQSYQTAIRHRRNYPVCYYNLGNLYMAMNQNQLAVSAFHQATQLNPHEVNAWTNLVILLDNLGRIDDVERVAKQIDIYEPSNAYLHYNLANAYGKAGKMDASERRFLLAVSLRPNEASFYLNLGTLYHRWKKYLLAKENYEKALQLDPSSNLAKRNLKMLLKTMKKSDLKA